jgi:hypothetical protein
MTTTGDFIFGLEVYLKGCFRAHNLAVVPSHPMLGNHWLLQFSNTNPHPDCLGHVEILFLYIDVLECRHLLSFAQT